MATDKGKTRLIELLTSDPEFSNTIIVSLFVPVLKSLLQLLRDLIVTRKQREASERLQQTLEAMQTSEACSCKAKDRPSPVSRKDAGRKKPVVAKKKAAKPRKPPVAKKKSARAKKPTKKTHVKAEKKGKRQRRG